MKEYLVQCNGDFLMYNEFFLVKAKSKKEAIDIVYNRFGQEFHKKDFTASHTQSLYEEDDNIVVIR